MVHTTRISFLVLNKLLFYFCFAVYACPDVLILQMIKLIPRMEMRPK